MMVKNTFFKAVWTAVFLIMTSPVMAQTAYRLEVVAKTGEALGANTPIALGPGPSINDTGKVAFIARDTDATHGRVMLLNNGAIEENCSIGTVASVSESVQVNENDQVIFRLYTDDGLFSDVVRIDNNCGGPIIGRGSFSPSFPQPFDYVLPPVTLNDTGRGMFSADIGTNTVLATRAGGSGSHQVSPALTGFPDLYPMLADNNTTVIRWGGSSTSPLLRFINTSLTTANFIAEAANYNAIGQQPGISDDGNVVAFVGDHKTQGFGIYVSLFNGSDFTPIKVLGIPGNGTVSPVRAYVDTNKNNNFDTGEDNLGRFATYSLQPRVGVNRKQSGSASIYTLAFIAFDSVGKYGLYTLTVNITNPLLIKVSEPISVVKLDESVFGLNGVINNIKIYDPLNNSGQVAFWASTTAGVQVIVRAIPVGRVLWQSGQPIQGAVIEAYYLLGNDSALAQIVPIPPVNPGQSVTSDANGNYIMPVEFYTYPLQAGEVAGRRGVRAKITYVEDTGIQTPQTIINYPEWDAVRPLKTPTTQGLDIIFPDPVFFNSGVTTRINDNTADLNLRAFLTMDNGSTDAQLQTISNNEGIALADLKKWRDIKRGVPNVSPIPSFVYFAMPSKKSCPGIPSDNIVWGYDNCIPQKEERVKSSVTSVLNHFTVRIRPQIALLSPRDADTVPFHFLGHSLGGVILRAVIKNENRTYPQVAKYVTFDAPHGGVSYANNFIIRFFDDFWSESNMNGTNNVSNQKPVGNNKSWNEDKKLLSKVISVNKSKLYFSSLNNLLPLSRAVTPDPSAFGVGRIMRPTNWFNPLNWIDERPNGFCEKFLHGWTMAVTGEGHSIQNAPQAIISAARFLAADANPRLGTRNDPGVPLSSAILEEGIGGLCSAVNEPARHVKRYTIEVFDQGTQREQLKLPAGQQVTVRALLSGVGAQLKLVDSANVPLTFTPTSTQFTNNVFILESTLTIPVNGAKWQLTSGAANEEALSIIEIELLNSNQRGLAGPVNLHNNAGSPVALNIQVTDDFGNIATGIGGTGEITVVKPDGAEVALAVFDDGAHNDGSAADGVFGAFFTETQTPGRYSLKGDLDIDQSVNGILSRSAAGMFYVDSDAVITNVTTAERLVDDNANGKKDAIAIDFSFDISKTGSFRLSSELFDGAQLAQYLESNFTVTNAQVRQTVTLRIPAETVRKSTNGGPFTLTALDVSNLEQAIFVHNFINYQTGAYTKTDFDIPSKPVVFESISSYGPKAGGNTVLLLGKNLANVLQVYFGTQSAAIFAIVDENTISVQVPVWDGSHDNVGVRLVTPWQESFSPSVYTYTDNINTPIKLRLNVVGDGISGFINVVSSDPKTGNCPTIPGYFICYEFPAGTQITLSPNLFLSQTRFAAWDRPQCPGTGNCQFTLNAETRVAATFANNALLTSPSNGATLNNSAATFNYSQGSRVNAYRLAVQNTATGKEIFNNGETVNQTVLVSNLPDSGESLGVKLWSKSSDSNQWLEPPMTYNMTAYFRYGDPNQDHRLSAADASVAARNAVGLINLSVIQKKKADVTGDNQVTALDASWIARKAVGLVDKFPIEK